ncbi:hypothetical protein REPUB_Repub15cG0024600 [Reevesia pubescens]
MEANNSSSTLSVTISETFMLKGKGITLVLLPLAMFAMILTAIIYKCIRCRRNETEVDGQFQDGVELANRQLENENEIRLSVSL